MLIFISILIANLESGLNNHIHINIDVDNHVHMGTKKNFSNSWWVHIHVCYVYARGLLHMGYGLVVSLRIFDPGWKKMTLYVLCDVHSDYAHARGL